MSIDLSDDLRQALRAEGTPLRLVDPTTGEAYFVVPESAYVAVKAAAEYAEELRKASVPNERLRELAQRHRPPLQWFESDEESVFE